MTNTPGRLPESWTFHSGPFTVAQIPSKYRDNIVENPNIYACCRDNVDRAEVNLYTTPEVDRPDAMAITCRHCGRNQLTLKCGSPEHPCFDWEVAA